jgi:hypothetical protein
MLERIALLLKSEPVAVRTVLGLVVTIAATVGFDLDVEQVLGLVTSVIAIATFLARRKVTPVDPEVVASKLNSALLGQKGNA